VRVVAERAWPLWNPYEGYGLPLLADPSLQVAYPTTWLNLVLPPPAVYTILLVGHALLGGAGVAALGRRWGMSGMAAALAGAAWCASGPLLSAGSLHQHFCGAAWMAWVLLALESALAAPGARSAAGLGAVAAAEALTGSADMCLLTAVAAAGRVAFWLLTRPARTERRAVAATALGAVALAFALAAVQWLPSASLLTSVERGRLGPAEILYWSVHPLSVVDLFVPRFLADLPLSPGLRAALFEGREPFLISLYVGLSSLALVVFVRVRRGDPSGYTAAMALLFGLAALGRHVFVLSLLLTTPPFSLSRYPAKHALPFAMFWALLAGFGLDAWRRPWERAERRRATIALATLALVVIIAGAGALWVRRDVHPAMRLLHIPAEFPAEAFYLLTHKLDRTVAVALAAGALVALRLLRDDLRAVLALAMAVLAATDVATAGRGVNPVAPQELLAHRPKTLDLLGADIAERRLLSPTADLAWLNAHFVRGVAGWDRRASWALGMQDILAAPIGARWGIRGSYDTDVTGLATPAFHFLTGALLRNRATAVAPKLLRMGNVGYVVAVPDGGIPDLTPVGEVATIFDRPARVLKVTDALPPAWFVGGSRTADSPSAALLAIAEPDFDPASEIVLAGTGPRVPVPDGFRARWAIRERRADRLVVEVEASAGGHLVVAEAYQDGWRARVDGAAVTVVPANVLFRAVPVPAGSHQVELRYRPPAAFWGAGLTAAGLVALAALGFRRER
jgi:Bacterial membrane protein YfhO